MRSLKRIGKVFGVTVVLGLVLIYGLSARQLGRTYRFPVRAPRVPTDAAAIARGEHQVLAVLDCRGCHGTDHGGMWMMNSFAMGHIGGGNITPGRGSLVAGYTDEDWTRAIRHGIDRQGHVIPIMAAEAYSLLSDGDLGDTIAYLKTLPPVDRVQPSSRPGPLGRFLFLIGALPLPGAALDHQKVETTTNKALGPTAEYGQYLATTSGCYGCHGENLAGRPLGPNVRSSNITPAGIGSYSEKDFYIALRTGIAPGGRKLNPFMPSERAFSRLTDVEMKALWLWSRTVPSVALAK